MANPTVSKMREDLERMQLEELYENARQREKRKLGVEARKKRVEASIATQERTERGRQAICKHRKGGKGLAGLFNGSDANFALITHTLSHGPTVVYCMRCSKRWEPPNPALNSKKATDEQRTLYMKQYEEYLWARNAPTDNEPSGTVIFEFQKEAAA